MSYFAVLSGEGATSAVVAAGKLIPIETAQAYVARLASEISKQDGEPSFFWDDDDTGTSSELICDAEDALREGALAQSALGQLILACEKHGLSLRVWWAADSRDAFIRVPQTGSASETFSLLQQRPHANISFALRPNYSLKRTAA